MIKGLGIQVQYCCDLMRAGLLPIKTKTTVFCSCCCTNAPGPGSTLIQKQPPQFQFCPSKHVLQQAVSRQMLLFLCIAESGYYFGLSKLYSEVTDGAHTLAQSFLRIPQTTTALEVPNSQVRAVFRIQKAAWTASRLSLPKVGHRFLACSRVNHAYGKVTFRITDP